LLRLLVEYFSRVGPVEALVWVNFSVVSPIRRVQNCTELMALLQLLLRLLVVGVLFPLAHQESHAFLFLLFILGYVPL
jgi:hypothetical protein